MRDQIEIYDTWRDGTYFRGLKEGLKGSMIYRHGGHCIGIWKIFGRQLWGMGKILIFSMK